MDTKNPPIDHRASIRKRPSMYFGCPTSRGVVHAINELVSNGIDLYLRGEASRVGISVAGETITYTDDGPGLPYDIAGPGDIPLAEYYLTNYHTTPTADGHMPHIHLLGNGLGMMCVNAASEFLEVKTWRSGQLWTQQFQRGLPIAPANKVASDGGKGTTLSFRLDREVFSETLPDAMMLRRLMFEAAHLIPGITLECGKETFWAPDGLASLAELYYSPESPSQWHRPKPFGFNTRFDDIQINVGIMGDGFATTMYRSWANGSSTPLHGYHVDGLRDALRWAKLTPSIALIHVIMHKPEFGGPTRSRLNNSEVQTPIRDCLKLAFELWYEQQKPN
jgi:DNA gyrase subunit B